MPAPPKGPNPPAAPKPSGYSGRVLARCRVGDKLGRGATSHVFRAHYEPLAKDIAMKILAKDASSAEVRARFTSEARAVAKLNHENIVKVLDVVEDQGFLCILMELVAGPTLQDRIDDEGVLSPRHAFQIAAQIARALEAAHEEKLVHRDVKPANVMLVGPRGEETVKVVDFGLAMQQEMNRVGTPMFMSPEAAQGKRIDEKSDVYALGVCLYYMLTGVLPFTGATVKDILAAQVNVEAVPPSQERPQLGKGYDDLLKKLLVKSKGYRPTAAEAAEMLEQIADDLEEREVGVRRVRKKRKPAPKKAAPPNPALWAGLAVAGVVVVVLALVFSGGNKPAETTSPTGGQSPTVGPVVPTGPIKDPAETEFKDAEAWAAANPNDAKEAARRFAAIESKYMGTTWATQAGAKRMEAEERAKAAALVEPPKSSYVPPPRQDDNASKYAAFLAATKNFDWIQANGLAENISEVPKGVDANLLDRQVHCVEYLKDHFVNQLDVRLGEQSPKVPAKKLIPGAKDGEVLTGAKSTGLFVTDAKGENHVVPWTQTDLDSYVKRPIAENVLNSEDYKDAMVLAAFATLFGKTKEAARYKAAAFGKANSDPEHPDEMREEAKRVLGEE